MHFLVILHFIIMFILFRIYFYYFGITCFWLIPVFDFGL